MAISVIDSTTASVSAGTANGSVAFPLGAPLQNDVVVLVVGRDDAGPTFSGYTQAGTSTDIQVLYKRMGASPDTEAAFTGNGATLAILLWILRGVDSTTAEDAAATTGTGTSSVPDGPAITTVTDGAWVLSCAREYFVGNATAAPSGYSNFLAIDAGTPNAMGAWKEVSSAGAENPGAFTADAANWAAITWAVRPAASAPAASTSWHGTRRRRSSYHA